MTMVHGSCLPLLFAAPPTQSHNIALLRQLWHGMEWTRDIFRGEVGGLTLSVATLQILAVIFLQILGSENFWKSAGDIFLSGLRGAYNIFSGHVSDRFSDLSFVQTFFVSS